MGTTLQHGIFLPAEGERNCYAGLASNWTILDGVVGGYSSHAANLTIHVTAADKEAWNGKADTSALTAHTGDTTIHVTAEDKTKWDAVTTKANDANVVHTSGNETVGGEKTFDAGHINVKSTIQEMGVIPQTSTLQYMPFMDKNNVIHGLVGLWDYDNGASEIQLNISDIFKNGVKDKTGTLDTSFFSFGFLGSGVKFTTFGGQLNNSLIPLRNSIYDVGSSSYKWKTINGLEPSSLSLPDLSNAVDISGYITDLTGLPNIYSPPANGYIAIRSTTANVLGIVENTTGMGSYSRGTNQTLAVNLPVVKNSSIAIYAICSSLTHAKFIPCQGNV